MMGYSNRHGRYFWRLLNPKALLYTEMIVATALLRGNRSRLLAYHASEQPLALQLAGCRAQELAEAASVGEAYGFVEINLNAGCPSPRVQQAGIGAVLMRDAQKLAELIAALRAQVSVPVSLKCRLALDDQDSEARLDALTRLLVAAGLNKLIVHARRALLKGLGPKANRSVPPLDYDRVYRLKASFPELEIILNGGLQSPEQIDSALQHTDGVMLGRAACSKPWLLSELHSRWQQSAPPELAHVLEQLEAYASLRRNRGVSRAQIFKLATQLYRDQPGARRLRHQLLAG